jgi:hypothetical protein
VENAMNKLLKEKLLSFQHLTVSIIKALEEENYDTLESILNGRQNIINEIEGLTYTQEQFFMISSEFKLTDLENMLNKLLNEKKQNVRAQIDKIKVIKNANNNYQKGFKPDSLFFNKKI